MSIYYLRKQIVSDHHGDATWSTRLVAILFLLAVAPARPSVGMAQQLVLTAGVEKQTFFEGEPIYLLVRLQNVGTDTAWVRPFNLFSPAVTLFAGRGYADPSPVAKPTRNYSMPPSWRGEPIPPGTGVLNTMVLENIFGDEWDSRRHLFTHHLAPNEYELRVEFDAHGGVPGTTPLTVKSTPVAFQIRVATSAEANEVKELEAMRQMGWDTTRVAGLPRAARYSSTLINWVDRRWTDQPDDPFLPFLLYDGLYGVGQILWNSVQAGEVQRFDPDTSEVVSRLRLAVIGRRRGSNEGAHLVQALTARHPDQMVLLRDRLSGTPAGDMARYQVERKQHDQQLKQQRPR